MRTAATALLAGSGLAALVYGIASEFMEGLAGPGRLVALLGLGALIGAIELRARHRRHQRRAAERGADVPSGYTPSPFLVEPPADGGGTASGGGGGDGGSSGG